MENKNLKKYMEEVLPGKNKKETIKQKKEEIMALHSAGYTFSQIAEYMKKTYRIRTSRQTIADIVKNEVQNECK